MTPFSIPQEIFDQLRRELRDQSGLPSYDPNDPSIPNLQPYQSCISRVDSSPQHLRCSHCKGRLLSGVNSLFCVFCGKERFGESMPDPLNFRDSKGYAWLLEALELDGSENVVQISGEEEPYRGKDRTKDEILLSDLLSLEIKWSVPAEKPAISGGADYAQPKSSLGGVDNNFFEEGTTDVDSSKPEKKSGADEGSEASDSNVTQAPSNLSLFGSVPLPSSTVDSTNYENRKSMSAWEAEFQSAASETAQKASPSPDPFSGSSVDMSAHMDAMFGSGNDQKRNDAKPSSSNMDNWFDDDPRGNSNIGSNRTELELKLSHDAGPKPSSSDMDNWFDDDLRGSSNIGFNGQELGPKPSHDTGHSGVSEGTSHSVSDYAWFEDNQWLSNAAGENKNDISEEDDAWNDFTSSTNAVENDEWKHGDGVVTSNPTPPGDLFGSSNDLMVDFGFSGQDLFPGASSISMKPVNLSSVQSQASASDRVINMDAKEGSEEAVKQEGTNATSSELDQLQMLMSQMHDLSFMLDSNLSIPSMSGKTRGSEK